MFPVELLLRELLNNAVIRGSNQYPAKRVFCRLRTRPDRLLITVRDQGGGFDWASSRGRQSDPKVGADEDWTFSILTPSAYRFNRKGNSITAIKRFEPLITGTMK